MAQLTITGYPSNLSAQSVTIASGASASEIISTQGQALVGIIMPSAWTAADLGYKGCITGRAGDLLVVYDSGGNAEHTVVAASRFQAVPVSDTIFAPWVQILSVDATDHVTPVNQAADRTLILLFRNYLS